ncbi:NUDIX domain-containing protein [Thalassobacillus pellis]|uniref:NUDIX domain-containing protein n=1 Tax=Thalassobacillus pellis TaxID=748008 RepID=UPI00195FAC61|nr:NUDIX domain-containing protein [Thalassobacillus pellis]MBM7553548.1 8-oxo-dGTP pyrophosphatase MutT (NUDIX family) [Thalassobacillus pellis]
MKKLSAGLVLTDGEKFLGCHSTGNWFYDLPKGEVDSEEEPLASCIREAKEETGIDVPSDELIDLGEFEYNQKKNLYLFVWKVEKLPSTERMHCTTYFTHYYTGKETPEVDGYKYIPFTESQQYTTKNMDKVLQKVFEEIKKRTL